METFLVHFWLRQEPKELGSLGERMRESQGESLKERAYKRAWERVWERVWELEIREGLKETDWNTEGLFEIAQESGKSIMSQVVSWKARDCEVSDPKIVPKLL